MTVKVPPTGTRGAWWPNLPRGIALFLSNMNRGVFRRRHGMVIRGAPTLVLETVGAKSGEPRSAVLGYLPEGSNAWLIIASLSGAARNPAWLFNLAKDPHATVEFGDGRRARVAAQTLDGADLEAAWQRIAAEMPQYAGYVRKTDRAIPVLRLRSVSPGRLDPS